MKRFFLGLSRILLVGTGYLMCGLMWVIGVALGIVVIALVFCLLAWKFPDTLITASAILSGDASKPVTPSEIIQINNLIKGGHILPTSEVFSTLSGFYNAIITFLITMITILGFISYFYVRNTSKQYVHEIVEPQVAKEIEFRFDKDIQSKLDTHPAIQSKLNELSQSSNYWDDTRLRMETLLARVDRLESMLTDFSFPLSGLSNRIRRRRRAR